MPQDTFFVGRSVRDALLAGVRGVFWAGGLQRCGNGAVGGRLVGFMGRGRGFTEIGVRAHLITGVIEIVGRQPADLYAGGKR